MIKNISIKSLCWKCLWRLCIFYLWTCEGIKELRWFAIDIFFKIISRWGFFAYMEFDVLTSSCFCQSLFLDLLKNISRKASSLQHRQGVKFDSIEFTKSCLSNFMEKNKSLKKLVFSRIVVVVEQHLVKFF